MIKKVQYTIVLSNFNGTLYIHILNEDGVYRCCSGDALAYVKYVLTQLQDCSGFNCPHGPQQINMFVLVHKRKAFFESFVISKLLSN